MEEILNRIRKIFIDKANIIIFLLIILIGLNVFGLKQNEHHFVKTKNKIDHRYFNTTRSLEDIHKIEINTLNGEIKPARN